VKGISIIRAKPSNVLDAYDLYKRAFKEGVQQHPIPSAKETSEYHWQLLEELKRPEHIILLAKKGKAYLGIIHGIITQRSIGPKYVCFARIVFVLDKKRKLGVGKKLLEELTRVCAELGVTRCEFMCDDSLVEYWQKARGAKKISNYMIVEA
jgi:GNAT superfamily N-acetyltransferase